METSKYVLENEAGSRYDLTAPASIFMVNVEGLGSVAKNSFAEISEGFYLQTRYATNQEPVVGELVYQAGAFGNYQTLVNWIMAAKTLYLCYTPLNVEYRRIVRLRDIGKSKRDGAGWMRAKISFEPETPWYLQSPAELDIAEESATAKRYDYVYTGLKYGSDSAGAMTAQIAPRGHTPSGIVLRYYGAITSPEFRLTGVDTGKVYGICSLNVTTSATDTIELSTLPEDSYVKKIAANGTETNLLDKVDLAFDPFFRAPVTEPSVLSIESDAAFSGTADIFVVAYYRTV